MTAKQEGFLKSLIRRVNEKLGEDEGFEWERKNLMYMCNLCDTCNGYVASQITTVAQASQDIAKCLEILK